MAPPTPCEHLAAGQLTTELPLEDWFGTAEAITSCPICPAHYLIELLDIDGPRRAFRLTMLDKAAAALLIRDFTRGSCDPGRAAAEVNALKAQYPRTNFVIVSHDGSLRDLQLIHASQPLPSTHWRELPMRGEWLRETLIDPHLSTE